MTWMGPALLVYVIGFTVWWLGVDLYEWGNPSIRNDPDWQRFRWRMIVLWPLFPLLMWWERLTCQWSIQRGARELRRLGLTKQADAHEAKFMAMLRGHD